MGIGYAAQDLLILKVGINGRFVWWLSIRNEGVYITEVLNPIHKPSSTVHHLSRSAHL